MNKHNVGIVLLSLGGALFLVNFVAGLQASNAGTDEMPSWYPNTLVSIETKLPISLEYILAGAGAVLLYV